MGDWGRGDHCPVKHHGGLGEGESLSSKASLGTGGGGIIVQ